MENLKIYMEPISSGHSEADVEGRNTHTTSISSLNQLIEIDANIIAKVKDSVVQIGNTFSDIVLADEVEMEFSFGITGNGNICILSGSSSLGIKVTFKLNKSENIRD